MNKFRVIFKNSEETDKAIVYFQRSEQNRIYADASNPTYRQIARNDFSFTTTLAEPFFVAIFRHIGVAPLTILKIFEEGVIGEYDENQSPPCVEN